MAEYINNKEFYNRYCVWKTEYRKAIFENRTTPIITEELGEAVILICSNLARKSNFSSYSYRDEMIDDGIEACIKAIPKFDETNYANIFAYFTSIAFNAFVKRIKIEKKHQKIKLELIKDSFYEGIVRQEFDSDEYQTQMREIIMSTIDSNSMDDRIRELALEDIQKTINQVNEECSDDEENPEDSNMDIF